MCVFVSIFGPCATIGKMGRRKSPLLLILIPCIIIIIINIIASAWANPSNSETNKRTRRDLLDWIGVRVHQSPISRRSAGAGPDIRQSAYVCEDGDLELSCTEGKHIDVLRANFGRFSITLCNPSGFLDWSVNCASGNSLPVLTERCSGLNRCVIPASSSIFGDPCPSTSKYLEVHYRCSSAKAPATVEINSNPPNVTFSRKSPLLLNNRKLSDNGNAGGGGGGGKELISPVNSLSPRRVLTPSNHSSIQTGDAAGSGVRHPPVLQTSTHGLNQDLLQISNYLNAKCNQPDSETYGSGATDGGKIDTKCKQHYWENNISSNQKSSIGATKVENVLPPVTLPNTDSGGGSNLPSEFHQQDNSNPIVELNNIDKFVPTIPTADASAGGDGKERIRRPPPFLPTSTGLSSTCEPIIYRDIHWPQTMMDAIAIRPCPPSTASGLAQWRCSHFSTSTTTTAGQAMWDNLPDLSQCNSRWLLELYQNVNNLQPNMWRSILANLEAASLYGGDLVELNTIFYTALQSLIVANPPSNGRFVKQNLSQMVYFDTVFEIVSVLLDKNNEPVWLDLPAEKRQLTALSLMDIAMKYSSLFCLDKRHFNGQKEVIKQSEHLMLSCYSISSLLHEFQLNWQTTSTVARRNISLANEFKFKLFASPQVEMNDVRVYMIISGQHMPHTIIEDLYFGALIPPNMARYFTATERHQNRITASEVNPRKNNPRTRRVNRFTSGSSAGTGFKLINSHVVKIFQFNSDRLINDTTTAEQTWYWFEIVFKHQIEAKFLHHECVHWDEIHEKWSNEQCSLVDSNMTHSICRCNILSTCTILATDHSTNSLNASRREEFAQLGSEHSTSSIWSAILILYSWIALLLIRCHDSYFNRFNFILLFLICLMRTGLELLLISSSLVWPYQLVHWCRTLFFAIIFILQVISSLFATFVFQNVIHIVLATKVYLNKNYSNSLHAINRSKQIQLLISVLFPLIHLALLYVMTEKRLCWPHYGDTLNAFFVTSPVLQAVVVLIGGVIFLHCSQKIFSDYDYPNMQYMHTDTTAFEKHIKQLFFNRCKHGILWSVASVVYLFAVVGCLCGALLSHHTSYALIGVDTSLCLAVVLFIRIKYVCSVIHKCADRSSTPRHSSKELSSLASIRENSISILSESSKPFLTLPGQISLGKMLESPKIYPSGHQSSSTYISNPSSHLYESPKHLYNYEFERPRPFYHTQAAPPRNASTPDPAYRHYLGSVLTPMTLQHHNPPLETNNINLSLRANHPFKHPTAHFPFDRSNSIFS